MDFGVLGPLEVRTGDGSVVALGRGRQRAVLARLLIDAGRVVSASRLVEDVWGGRPPATAAKVLQKHISELRRLLPAGVIRTVAGGYVTDVDDDAIDARRFERLVTSRRFADALALWRGEVLADLDEVEGLEFVAPERARLEELRMFAVEGRMDEELVAGRHAEVVVELGELVDAHPLRERLVGQHMLALYRSGRQVEALRAYERHRRRLVEEVGVEPDAELRRLQGAMLRQDPELDRVDPAHERGGDLPVAAIDSRGNLPLALTSFVGRRVELDAATQVLASHRLATFTGPAGVGKTRLAIEVAAAVAERFPGGVWVVDLAPVVDPDLVAFTIASALGVATRHAADDRAAVAAALAQRPPSLLVLDNCEHLLDACAEIARLLLRSAPSLRVLATSRRPLGVDGEFVRPVPPLPEDDAADLLADRARLVGLNDAELDGELAREICRQLDGLPLAIELAAGQLRALTAAEVAERLHEHLSFRGAGRAATPRRRTLGDMVRASYDALPVAVQRTFARLGAFSSSFTLAAAEAVCVGDGVADRDVLGHLTTLLDNSLLVRDPAPGRSSRYRLLETLRLFALDRLAEGDREPHARRAHATYYCRLAEDAGRGLYGPHEYTERQRLNREEPNLHAAARWAADHDPELAVRLVLALWSYWDVRWGERHAVAYIEELLAAGALTERQRAAALTVAADLAANGGDARRAIPWAVEAVATLRRVGDVELLGRALLALGSALGNRGALDAADAALAEAMRLVEPSGDPVVMAHALDRLSFVATRRGDHERAAELSRTELDHWVAVGSCCGEASALRHAATALHHLGDDDTAAASCRRAIELCREMGPDDGVIAHARLVLADIERVRGNAAEAVSLYREALGDFQTIGDRRCTASTYKNLASIAVRNGEHHRAGDLLTVAVRLRRELGDEAGLAECFELCADVEFAAARYDEAAAMLAAASAVRRRTGSEPAPGEAAATATLLDEARRRLGHESFAVAFARGAGWSAAEAADHLLGTT